MSFKVDFMIIGAMKSGTTNLAKQLAKHSQICFCQQKEPQFFSTTPDWEIKLNQYHDLFQPLPNQIAGEGSTSYSFLGEYPEVVDRLYAYNPNLKLIYLVRDPIERIRSHYSHRLMHGIANIDPKIDIMERKKEYINRSLYGFTVQEYLKKFSSSQLLVIDFKEYITSPVPVLKKVCNFLDIPYENISEISARNTSVGSNRSPLSPVYYLDKILSFSPPALRRLLGNYISIKLKKKPEFSSELELFLWNELESDVDLLEKLTDINVEPWRQKRAMLLTKSGEHTAI